MFILRLPSLLKGILSQLRQTSAKLQIAFLWQCITESQEEVLLLCLSRSHWDFTSEPVVQKTNVHVATEEKRTGSSLKV